MFVIHGVLCVHVGQNKRLPLNSRRFLFNLLCAKLAQRACGRIELETASWGLSDGFQQLRQCGKLARDSG